MSKLRERLAALPDFEITGYEAYKGINILFNVETSDTDLQKKILTNTLIPAERNYIISSVNEYFVDTVQTDENLFNYAVGDIVVENMEGTMDIPDGLLNEKFIEEKCMQKKQGTSDKVFSKNKFRLLPLQEKLNIVNDMYDFIDFAWTGDYLDNKDFFDIRNLIKIPGMSPEDFEDQDVASLSSFRRRYASLK